MSNPGELRCEHLRSSLLEAEGGDSLGVRQCDYCHHFLSQCQQCEFEKWTDAPERFCSITCRMRHAKRNGVVVVKRESLPMFEKVWFEKRAKVSSK